MTVASDNLVKLHRRIALLEALANHLRQCGLCRYSCHTSNNWCNRGRTS